MSYIELKVAVSPVEPFTDILIAALSDLSFDTFEETDNGFNAYAESGTVDLSEVEQIIKQYQDEAEIQWTTSEIPKENWNATWESSFEPVEVDDKVVVRAAFHPAQPGFRHEIVITPKMSFGTGHHQTTWLMMKTMSEIEFANQKVLDMGCGTGVLGILAAMSGASEVFCYDIDEWAVENTIENARINGVSAKLKVGKGDLDDLQESGFFAILANINRNVLTRHLPGYKKKLLPGGHLLMSGFYKEDIPAIIEHAERSGFVLKSQDTRDNWAVLRFSN